MLLSRTCPRSFPTRQQMNITSPWKGVIFELHRELHTVSAIQAVHILILYIRHFLLRCGKKSYWREIYAAPVVTPVTTYAAPLSTKLKAEISRCCVLRFGAQSLHTSACYLSTLLAPQPSLSLSLYLSLGVWYSTGQLRRGWLADA